MKLLFEKYRLLQKNITPTKPELLKAMKICDILNPSFQALAGDICYLF